MTAAERFTDFARRVQAEATRALPTIEEVYSESSEEDHDRADRLTRNLPDMLVTVGRHVQGVNNVAFDAWEFFSNDRNYWDASENMRSRFMIVLRILRSCAWAWHQRARVVLSPELEKVRGVVFSASWHAYLSTTLLIKSVEANIVDRGVQLVRTPLLFLERAGENSFVRHLLAAGQANFVLTKSRVGAYNVGMWKATLDGLWEAINRFGITPSAARLHEALTLRYAAWYVHDDADYEHVSESDIDDVFSHWTLCHDNNDAGSEDGGDEDDNDDAYTGPLPEDARGLAPMLSDAVLPLHERLRTSFVIQGEMMLYHGIRHINAMRAFITHTQARPLVMPEAWRRGAAKELIVLAKGVLRKSGLTTDATETIKSLLMRRHLRPGDAEQAMFEAGSRIGLFVEGDEVMYDIRRAEFTRINKDVLPLDVSEHLTDWQLALEGSMALPFTAAASDNEWDAIAARRPRNERAAFLVIETALDIFLRVRRVNLTDCSLRKFGYMDDAGLVPPLDAPPPSPEEACIAIVRNECKVGTPLFVAIAHVYCVVLPGAGNETVRRVLFTPHLIDALVTWLAVCHQLQLLPANVPQLRPLTVLMVDAQLLAQLA